MLTRGHRVACHRLSCTVTGAQNNRTFLLRPSVTILLFGVVDEALQTGSSVRRATERYALRTLGRFSTVV